MLKFINSFSCILLFSSSFLSAMDQLRTDFKPNDIELARARQLGATDQLIAEKLALQETYDKVYALVKDTPECETLEKHRALEARLNEAVNTGGSPQDIAPLLQEELRYYDTQYYPGLLNARLRWNVICTAKIPPILKALEKIEHDPEKKRFIIAAITREENAKSSYDLDHESSKLADTIHNDKNIGSCPMSQ